MDMSNPKSQTIPEIFELYLIMLIIYCVDLFGMKTDLTIVGDVIYSRFVSFGVIFIYLWAKKSSVELVGIDSRKKRLKKNLTSGLINGTVLAVLPMVAFLILECIYYGIADLSLLKLNYSPKILDYIQKGSALSPFYAIAIYFVATFVASAFKEMFFRGLVLKKLKVIMGFMYANIAQTLLYLSFAVLPFVRNFINAQYSDKTIGFVISLTGIYLAYEAIGSIKRGYLIKVTGTVYVAIVEQTLSVFLASGLFVTEGYKSRLFVATQLLLVQIISLVPVFFYYTINMKKIKSKKERERLEKVQKHKTHQEKKNKTSAQIINQRLDSVNAISPEQFKSMVEESNHSRSHRHHHHRHSSDERASRNERHSKVNDALIESIKPEDISQKADSYLADRLSSSHHSHRSHHSHHSHHSPETIEIDEKLLTEEITKLTDEYSDSLALERKTPKHPHPHDKIARDSLLSDEAIEKANADKIGDYAEDDVDAFIKSFNEDMTRSTKHSRHRSHRSKSTDSQVVDEVFNADEFLDSFNTEETVHSHRSHRRHHHSTDEVKSEVGKAEAESEADDNKSEFQRQLRTVNPITLPDDEQPKKGLLKKIKELGSVDTDN